MTSKFCQWCIDLQQIADKDGGIIEAQMHDLLDYLFRAGVGLEEAYLSYKETRARIKAINKQHEILYLLRRQFGTEK